ncbi:MAG: methionine--tRNA ligase subunit beta, partial [Lentisphaerae bacterium GWF2_52_8]
RFFNEKDLVDGALCPECRRETGEIIESNYFFRMSKYQDWLIDYIKTHPDFILPAFRANEVLGFLKRPLEDLCISRPKSRLTWGIELPFDKDYVCYVWFDALINYISAIGYGSDDTKFAKWWPATYHLMAKDILTTHTVYWPTMLKAMGVELPRTIFAHGWWLTGQEKMSKSLGNVVNPMDMIDRYGVDSVRYFLMAEMVLGQDASFTEEAFITRYNSDLANDLGNLLSRVTKMTLKQCGGILPAPGADTPAETELKEAVLGAAKAMEAAITEMRLDKGIEQVLSAVRAGNRYMEKTAPWTLAKSGDTARLGTVLYTAAESLRIVSGLLCPVMPQKMKELRHTLGLTGAELEDIDLSSLKIWGGLKPGSKLNDISALFLRINKEENPSEAPKDKKAMSTEKPAAKVSADMPEGLISIEDFGKVQLRTAKVLAAEKIEGADKLLKLQIDIDGAARQIVAGVALYYKPEDMIGKTIVVVANLKPAKIRGLESNGMLLAAKDGKDLRLVTVEGGFKSGASVG